MPSYLRPRRGKKSLALSQNIILKRGEVFFEMPETGVGKGLGKIKVGDGSTAYKDLPYFIEDNHINICGKNIPGVIPIIQWNNVTFSSGTVTINLPDPGNNYYEMYCTFVKSNDSTMFPTISSIDKNKVTIKGIFVKDGSVYNKTCIVTIFSLMIPKS